MNAILGGMEEPDNSHSYKGTICEHCHDDPYRGVVFKAPHKKGEEDEGSQCEDKWVQYACIGVFMFYLITWVSAETVSNTTFVSSSPPQAMPNAARLFFICVALYFIYECNSACCEDEDKQPMILAPAVILSAAWVTQIVLRRCRGDLESGIATRALPFLVASIFGGSTALVQWPNMTPQCGKAIRRLLLNFSVFTFLSHVVISLASEKNALTQGGSLDGLLF